MQQVQQAHGDASLKLCVQQLAFENERKTSRDNRLEAALRTVRFVNLVGAVWGLIHWEGETLRQILRPPGPKAAEFARHFAALLDVKPGGKREENLKRLKACKQVVDRVLASAQGASGTDASTGVVEADKQDLGVACQSLIEQ